MKVASPVQVDVSADRVQIRGVPDTPLVKAHGEIRRLNKCCVCPNNNCGECRPRRISRRCETVLAVWPQVA